MSKSIKTISNNMALTKIIVITHSGYTARMISRFRLHQPILAVSDNKKLARLLQLYYGVTPVYVEKMPQTKITYSIAGLLKQRCLVEDSDTVLFSAESGQKAPT